MAPTLERDRRLMAAIAEGRDRDAFAELFAQLEKPAYSLAHYLTRDKDTAEEAVQEAFLRVWRSAHTFRADGKPRSWVLRIVAGKSLEILRRKRRNREKMERAQQQAVERTELPAADGGEQHELLAVLRRQLERLPEMERQLIALYYGGELTQDEIAEQLDMPQRTVSFRLQKTLAQLRERLAGAGFAAALPEAGGGLGGGELLNHAILSGPQVPPGLGDAITAKLGSAAAEVSQRAVVAKGFFSPLAWTAIVVAAVAGTGAYVWLQAIAQPAVQHPAVPQNAETKSPGTAGAAETKAQPVNRTWSFRDGPAEGLFVMQNMWTWRKGTNGEGEMVINTYPGREEKLRDILLLLPQRFEGRPLRIEMDVRGDKDVANGHDVMWAGNEGEIAAYKRWGRMVKFTNNELTVTAYAIGRYVVFYLAGKLYAVHEYEKPYPGDRILLLITSYHVKAIRVTGLDENDPAVRAIDPEKEIRILKKDKKLDYDEYPVRQTDWSKVPEVFR